VLRVAAGNLVVREGCAQPAARDGVLGDRLRIVDDQRLLRLRRGIVVVALLKSPLAHPSIGTEVVTVFGSVLVPVFKLHAGKKPYQRPLKSLGATTGPSSSKPN